MVQAARSGKQNIVEGSEAAATNKESELNLTNVAKASLEELLEDYLDYLKAHDYEEWPKDSEKGLAARRLGRNDDYEKWSSYFREKPDEVVANLLVSLIRQCTYLLSRQIAKLEEDFVLHGGIRERMRNARTAARGNEWNKTLYSRLDAAKDREELDKIAKALHNQIRRTAFGIAKRKGWA